MNHFIHFNFILKNSDYVFLHTSKKSSLRCIITYPTVLVGLEPTTFHLTGECTNLLCYRTLRPHFAPRAVSATISH